MTSPGPGRFITLEGGEGAGKSTQISRLKAWLEARATKVIATREPGGSPGAEMVRKLLVEGPAERWDGVTEALLHFAARRDHLRVTVWPALAAGTWVNLFSGFTTWNYRSCRRRSSQVCSTLN